ncbi:MULTISPECIES: type ISP restriction/modification enzyme [unclassified Streptomyces]|uniref:type ISP restriction/modification enzyme n=1 Tax=unclassified Streptomyces TaxID=2593676 RepID=UPI002E805823|nr:type ISP restriction/modification enzyme [Streptomyces sp. NBC_00589]WTI39641.1 N-6 DNA methylase [Streptomyces sp. NBC_00775]WUB26680.1 N-6 DNA methylase [Streptomyces sp. NBC_00589]
MGVGTWIERVVADFGAQCKQILGVGEHEAGIRSAVEKLLGTAAEEMGLRLRLHPEARLTDLGIRPDFAASLGENKQRTFGYVELKSPRKRDISPGGLRGRDRKQWEAMSRLPNVIYTNGQTWFLYQNGQQQGNIVHLEGDIYRAGRRLRAPGATAAAFERMLRDFLFWQPSPLTTVRQLVTTIAPLCGLLRAEVHDRLREEERVGSAGGGRRGPGRPFTELAQTWEHFLFPHTDERDHKTAFSDRYAQTVTFALLLARADDISLTDQSLHEVGDLLGADHTVMGKALQILTDHVGQQFKNSLDVLVRVVNAVDWDAILEREPDAHVILYEHFLQEYDPELRKASGTYYTPAALVKEMVRLVDEVLRLGLDCSEGFADSRVTIIDPAMGTGTFLSSIIDLVAERRSAGGNSGFRSESIEELAQRLIGFEKQMAAYAVAQMRISQTLRAHDSHTQLNDLRLHLNDTLADPWDRPTLFGGAGADVLRRETEAANHIKKNEQVTVVIGNPPDREDAQGEGGWIEKGSVGHGPPLLDRFRLRGANGVYEKKLKNLYVYFWRWATYKVFEQHRPAHHRGIVCFVTTAGFLRGPGFKGMREYLRSTCSEGWIIDLTPEGKQPPTRTRFFPGVQQELAIALFVRKHDSDPHTLAPVHYSAVTGTREEKQGQLANLHIGGTGWQSCHPEAHDPFTPAPSTRWADFPALGDIMPWSRQGMQTKRTWVYGVDEETLQLRWSRLIHEPDPQEKRILFSESRDRKIGSTAPHRLPGQPGRPLIAERGDCPPLKQILHRSFDRQWVIPDSRVIDYPRPGLWDADRDDQLFLVEQHSRPIKSGPAVIFSALIPDMHCFNNDGGRVLPLRHPDGSPNIAPGLLEHLANAYGLSAVSADDLAAYVAGVTAHPAFTQQFSKELNSPGVRIPITADRQLWLDATQIGYELIRVSTFDERFNSGGSGTGDSTTDPITYAVRVDPSDLPHSLAHDSERQALLVGKGVFLGVSERMRHYDVGGRKILDSWFAARCGKPKGRNISDLDWIRSERWTPRWSSELIEILKVLQNLTNLEPLQALLLERVLNGPLIEVAELTRRGVLQPPAYTKAPRQANTNEEMLPGMDDLDGQPPSPVQPLNPAPPDRLANPKLQPHKRHNPQTRLKRHPPA